MDIEIYRGDYMDLLQDTFFDAIKILKRLDDNAAYGALRLLEVMSDEFQELKSKYEDLISDGKYIRVMSNPGWEVMTE